MVLDNMHEVLAIKEANLNFAVQGFYRGSIM